jgi:hypothetical protein
VKAIEAASNVIAAIVAVLGATGYIILLGAVILWVRLREAGFSKEVPLSFASREELLVIGAQALAVWLVLALALAALSARLAGGNGLTRRDVAANLILGLGVTGATLAMIEGREPWVIIPVAALAALSLLWFVGWGLTIRPPAASWIAAILPAGLGIVLPLFVSWIGDSELTGTVLTAWVAFALVLVCVPALKSQRDEIAANDAAVSHLELDREHQTAGHPGVPPPTPTATHLLATLQANLRAARARLWIRGAGVLSVGLLLLGSIAVASQFEKKHLFREAVVSLKSGRCLKGTYVARNKDHVVIGDQRGTKDEKSEVNRVLIVPTADVVEVQLNDPAELGVPLEPEQCEQRALAAPGANGQAPAPSTSGQGANGQP